MARAVTAKSVLKTAVAANVAYPLIDNLNLAAGHKPTTVCLIFTADAKHAGDITVGDKNLLIDGGLPVVTFTRLYDSPMNQKEVIHFDMTKIYYASTVAGKTLNVTYYAFVD